MRFQLPESNDLIIGMSLAELFLFIMLLTSWTSALPATAGGVPPTIEIANLKSRIQELEARNATLTTEVNDLQTRIEALRIALGADPNTPLTAETVRQHDAKVMQDARRGAPVCSPENTLMDVTATLGRTSVVLRGHPELLGGPWTANQLLTDPLLIDEFLAAVLRYSTHGKCRFDYSLRYSTPNDFYQRKKFEQYLYPGPITHEP